jgi:hypothetical protein
MSPKLRRPFALMVFPSYFIRSFGVLLKLTSWLLLKGLKKGILT